MMKVSIILLVGLATASLLRRQSAAARHWVLAATLACAVSTPLLEIVIPAWQLSAAPHWFGRAVGPLILTAPLQLERSTAFFSQGPAGILRPGRANVMAIASLVWKLGMAASLLTVLVGLFRLSWLRRLARPVDSSVWSQAAERLKRQYGLPDRIQLLESRSRRLLATWGVRRPTILIPPEAQAWPPERVRLVLGHELAHIARRDWLVQLVGEIFRSVYWFNPLVWILCRRLRNESEHACDDAVLALGVSGSDYAGHLLDVARAVVSPSSVFPAPAMARPSTLERRVRAMLNDQLNRTPVSRAAGVAILVALVGLTVPLAGLAVSAQSATTTFSGKLLDAVGRILPNASLGLANSATNQRFEARSDENGQFAFAALPAGDYNVQAKLPGFAPSQGRLMVVAGENLVRDVVLQIGSIEETVLVGGNSGASAPQPLRRAGASGPEVDACSQSTVGGCIKPPRRIADMRPRYPQRHLETGTGGLVKIDGRIGTDGFIKDLRVIAPADADFAAAAIEAVSQWQFTATRLDGIPVEAGIHITVRFSS